MTQTTGGGIGAGVASDNTVAVEIEVPDVLKDRLG
jgi:hypothetical protein